MALTKISGDGYKDESVDLSKLPHGDSNTDGKFLRANNGADPTFETVNTTPEGTAILSTNETGGNKFLREDGDGTCSWQAVPTPAAFDDNDILNDISTLALQVNSLQNATKFTSNSVFVDNFKDATGVNSFSSTVHDLNGFVKIEHNFTADQYWGTTDLDSSHVLDRFMTGFYASKFVDGLTNTWAGYINNPTSHYKGFYYHVGADSDFGEGFILTGMRFWNFNTNARFWYFKTQVFDQNATTEISNGNRVDGYKQVTGTDNYDTGYTDSLGMTIAAQNVNGWVGVLLNVPYVVPSNTSAIGFTFHAEHNNGNVNAGAAELQIKGKKFVSSNASGNFISNAITAPSSTSSMGAVILYKDHLSTSTLNTDIKIYLSADNGSNFTQGTLTALPSYDASGTKMAKVNDVTVTAGTQLKYKIELYNQAQLTKEVHITGVSLQY